MHSQIKSMSIIHRPKSIQTKKASKMQNEKQKIKKSQKKHEPCKGFHLH